MERFKVLMLHLIIKCKRMIPQHIVQAQFETHPFHVKATFGSISLLHQVWNFVDLATVRDWYPYLAYCSSEVIASTYSSPRAYCWFLEVMAYAPIIVCGHLDGQTFPTQILFQCLWPTTIKQVGVEQDHQRRYLHTIHLGGWIHSTGSNTRCLSIQSIS